MSPGAGDAGLRAPNGHAREAARAAFLARITAGATHDLRNVLAIVKESAGLVGDLVDAAGPGRAPDRSKIDWALDRIRLQVARGAELSTALNRVMHGLDEPEARIELEPAVEHAVLLARRLARRHECELVHVPGPVGLAVTCSGLDLSMALVGLMEWCVQRLPPSSAVEIEVEETGGGAAVRFSAAHPGTVFGDADPEAGHRLEQLAAWIPATVRTPDPGTRVLRFHESGGGPGGETP